MSHAGFLRDQHSGPEAEVVSLTRALYDGAAAASALPQEQGIAYLVEQAEQSCRSTSTSFLPDLPLIRFGLRLAFSPRTMRAHRLQPLRDDGWSDREIHDAVHVVACFSYMNRVADGLGVAVEASEWATRLLGPDRFEAHRRWADGL
ncbi:MAG: hypothetical protein AB8H79_06860 [Myxococcota bacterium]